VLTFLGLFTGRDAAITMNSVKNRNHAVMNDLSRSAITATAELLVLCSVKF